MTINCQFPRPFILVLGLLSAGCNTVTVDYYQKVTDGAADVAYVKPDVDFSQYTTLKADPLEIYFSQQNAPTQAELARARTTFREAFLAQIGDDYEIVQEAGPKVLAVRASLIQADATGAVGPARGRLGDLVASGKLTFLMELRDSESDEVLARAGDSDKASSGSDSSGWEVVDNAAARWAKLFRDFLDNNLGQE